MQFRKAVFSPQAAPSCFHRFDDTNLRKLWGTRGTGHGDGYAFNFDPNCINLETVSVQHPHPGRSQGGCPHEERRQRMIRLG
ncbi:hypothetical protein SETIT_2G306900v2 [Setaria italica]|uniref:Uncharacterized protein n=1 Tax=Setaria italica TaxID=4555 RepID=A0A368Q5G7_SETIT|nr:hypothetical protein SETIT_2G306900v2 [Setaria italica]